MKKIILLLAIIMLIVVNYKDTDTLIIPNESIRIRIIANSNEELDQYLKLKVKDKVQNNLNNLLKNASDIEEVRNILKENLNNINYTVEETLKVNKSNQKFKVDFSDNYFPKKEYKGVSYNEGLYESVVVTLGKGKGENFWCVLFPPLCLTEADENN